MIKSILFSTKRAGSLRTRGNLYSFSARLLSHGSQCSTNSNNNNGALFLARIDARKKTLTVTISPTAAATTTARRYVTDKDDATKDTKRQPREEHEDPFSPFGKRDPELEARAQQIRAEIEQMENEAWEFPLKGIDFTNFTAADYKKLAMKHKPPYNLPFEVEYIIPEHKYQKNTPRKPVIRYHSILEGVKTRSDLKKLRITTKQPLPHFLTVFFWLAVLVILFHYMKVSDEEERERQRQEYRNKHWKALSQRKKLDELRGPSPKPIYGFGSQVNVAVDTNTYGDEYWYYPYAAKFTDRKDFTYSISAADERKELARLMAEYENQLEEEAEIEKQVLKEEEERKLEQQQQEEEEEEKVVPPPTHYYPNEEPIYPEDVMYETEGYEED